MWHHMPPCQFDASAQEQSLSNGKRVRAGAVVTACRFSVHAFLISPFAINTRLCLIHLVRVIQRSLFEPVTQPGLKMQKLAGKAAERHNSSVGCSAASLESQPQAKQWCQLRQWQKKMCWKCHVRMGGTESGVLFGWWMLMTPLGYESKAIMQSSTILYPYVGAPEFWPVANQQQNDSDIWWRPHLAGFHSWLKSTNARHGNQTWQWKIVYL